MRHVMTAFINLKDDHRAVTALEYAILAGLVAAALVGMFATWGDALSSKLTSALG